MERPALEIDYEPIGDLLSLSNGGLSTGVSTPVTMEPDLDSFTSEDGKCVALYLFDAARILMPHLTADDSGAIFEYQGLRGVYAKGADTLTIGNGAPPASSAAMAEGLTAHYDQKGSPAGFTLERAAELLMPRLRTWRPSTAAETAAIRQRMDQQDTATRARAASGP